MVYTKKYFYNDQLFDKLIKENTEYDVIDSPNCVGISRKKSDRCFSTTLYITDDKGNIKVNREFDYLVEAIKIGQVWFMINNSKDNTNYFIDNQLFDSILDDSIEYGFSNKPLCVGIATKKVNNIMRYCIYETNGNGNLSYNEVIDSKALALTKASNWYLSKTSILSSYSNDEQVKINKIVK